MSENRPDLGENAQAGLSPVKRFRHQAGRFAPYPGGARRNSAGNALNLPRGDELHRGRFAFSTPNFDSRRARNLFVNEPYGQCFFRNFLYNANEGNAISV